MPFGMGGYPQAVVVKGKAYIGGGNAYSDEEGKTVIVYDPQQDSYEKLPLYSHKYFSMAAVNNQLVLIGGEDAKTSKKTNKLGVWNKSWTHPFPPMKRVCCSPAVATYDKWLVVVGGWGDEGKLSIVQILDTIEGQWYLGPSLPQPYFAGVFARADSVSYLLGGYSQEGESKHVFSVSLDELVLDLSKSNQAGAGSLPMSTSPSPWKKLHKTPHANSTALVHGGALLAIGGAYGVSEIFLYRPSSGWIEAGSLPSPRSHCACTVLPSGEVFVAGGSGKEQRSQVDIALVK